MGAKVIGVGSPFGADRLGWLAVDHLAKVGPADCEWFKLDRPGSRLLDYLKRPDRVVIIDAVVWGEQPGGIRRLSLSDLQRFQGLSSSHGFGLAETLALGAELDRLPQALQLFGIHSGDDLTQTPQIDLEALERLVLPYI
jgi:hydrogenase maturation protease